MQLLEKCCNLDARDYEKNATIAPLDTFRSSPNQTSVSASILDTKILMKVIGTFSISFSCYVQYFVFNIPYMYSENTLSNLIFNLHPMCGYIHACGGDSLSNKMLYKAKC